MPKANLSIVVPTHNRKEVLAKTLEAYGCQTAVEEILEILIVDDGSTDGTVELISRSLGSYPSPMRLLRQEKRGQAAARNYGIREAGGEIILFGDDDIIPAPHMVGEHLAWHRRYPEASVGILGYVTWDPAVRPTPFMKWLGESGPLFNFKSLTKGQVLDFGNFFSCNISIKTAFLRLHGVFDEDFRTYGYEDYELGFRLHRKGFRLLYNPDAVGYHHKFMSLADVCRRADVAEAALDVLETKEAGAYLKRPEARPMWAGELRRLMRHYMVSALTPLRPMLDSRFPLPTRVYRMFYNEYLESRINRRPKGGTRT
jgi:GT2 family glycosyltransferase